MEVWKIKYVDELKKMKHAFEVYLFSAFSISKEVDKFQNQGVDYKTAREYLNELKGDLTIRELSHFLHEKVKTSDSKEAINILTQSIWNVVENWLTTLKNEKYLIAEKDMITCRENVLKQYFVGASGDNPIEIEKAIQVFEKRYEGDAISNEDFDLISKGFLGILRDMSADNIDDSALYALFNLILMSDDLSFNEEPLKQFSDYDNRYYKDRLSNILDKERFPNASINSGNTIKNKIAESREDIKDRGNYLYLKPEVNGSIGFNTSKLYIIRIPYTEAVKEALYCIENCKENQREFYNRFKESLLKGLILKYCFEYVYRIKTYEDVCGIKKTCNDRLNYILVILFEHINKVRFDGEIPNIVNSDFLNEIWEIIREKRLNLLSNEMDNCISNLLDKYKIKLDLKEESNGLITELGAILPEEMKERARTISENADKVAWVRFQREVENYMVENGHWSSSESRNSYKSFINNYETILPQEMLEKAQTVFYKQPPSEWNSFRQEVELFINQNNLNTSPNSNKNERHNGEGDFTDTDPLGERP